MAADEVVGAAEHPAVRRIRHRRLLAFLWLQGLERTFQSMVRETGSAAFSVVHLSDLVTQGQWRDAIDYLSRFLRLDKDECLSVVAKVLHRFLTVHMDLADILAGTKRGDEYAAYFLRYHKNDGTVCHGSLRIRCIILTALHAKQHLRASLDWKLVRQAAADIVYELIYRTPEMKGIVLMPPSPLKPHNVLPIRSCTGRRCHRKKHRYQPQASVLAKRYLRKRGRLHISSHAKESPEENDKKMTWVADIFAGEPLKLHQGHLLQTNGMQGDHSNPISQSSVGTLTYHARNSVASSVRTAGCDAENVHQDFNPREVTASKENDRHPKRQRTSAPVASVEQATTLTSHTESSGSNKHCSQEGGNARSAHLGINPTKDPRKEPTAYDEQDHNPKRQHTSGLFGETDLMPGNEIQAGTHHELGVL